MPIEMLWSHTAPQSACELQRVREIVFRHIVATVDAIGTSDCSGGGL